MILGNLVQKYEKNVEPEMEYTSLLYFCFEKKFKKQYIQ